MFRMLFRTFVPAMKKTVIHTLAIMALNMAVTILPIMAFTACDDEETYAEKKEKERDAINKFLSRDVYIISTDGLDTLCHVGKINPITEETFYAQDSTTDVSKNEYVLFPSTGIYMQIVRQGVGERIQSGESRRIDCRFFEYNIMADSVIIRNTVNYWHTNPDVMEVSNSYGTFSGSFSTEGNGGAMYQYYNSTAVPAGWLVPLTYIRVGRQQTSADQIAKVRLILPHTQGTSNASTAIYPCFYEILYQEERQ